MSAMADSLRRFVFEETPVRGEIVQLGATWRAVLERHDYPPALRGILGELMAAAALLSATLKFSGSLVMQMQGSGPVQLIVVECTSAKTMRATATWAGGDLAPGTLKELLGAGRFAITLAPDTGDDPIAPAGAVQTYQGIVALEGTSVAEVLEHYMSASEQLDTRLWLAADDCHAAGLLLQKLPESGSGGDAWERAGHLGATVTADELLNLAPETLLRRLFHEEDLRLFEAHPVSFRCSCSRERVRAMLRMLGYDEVLSILREQGAVDVDCQFCNRHYRFDAVDAEEVFAAGVEAPISSARH